MCTVFVSTYTCESSFLLCYWMTCVESDCKYNLKASFSNISAWPPSLKVIPDSSTQRPLSAHLKFNSAPVKSLHTHSNLKEGEIPDIAPIWPVCLLFEIFYKLHLSTNDLWCRLILEGTRESVWTCACPRERYRNGTGAKRNHRSGLWIKRLRAPLCSHALLCSRVCQWGY